MRKEPRHKGLKKVFVIADGDGGIAITVDYKAGGVFDVGKVWFESRIE